MAEAQSKDTKQAETKGLLIQDKIEDMIDYAENEIQRWPPMFQKTQGMRILNQCYDISDLCEAANNEYYKKPKIKLLDEANKSLQRKVRRANRTKYINRRKEERQLLTLHKYITWSAKLTEIGSMIGGWLRWANTQPPPQKKSSKKPEPQQ